MNATDLKSLHGRSVLVKSAADFGSPQAGVRGTLDVHEYEDSPPQVRIAVEFPQMFRTRAHHREIILTDAELDRLLASEHGGTFEFTLRDELE